MRDTYGNPVPNQAVVLSVTGSGNAFTPASRFSDGGPSNSAGVFPATLKSTRAESKTVAAAFYGGSLAAQVTLAPGAPVAATSSLAATPASAVANGTSAVALTVTLKDAYGNLVPGQGASLSATGSANAFVPATGTTNGSGLLASSLTLTSAATKGRHRDLRRGGASPPRRASPPESPARRPRPSPPVRPAWWLTAASPPCSPSCGARSPPAA